MTVGDEDGLDPLLSLIQPRKIGMQNIDADVIVGKTHTAIHDENAPLALEREAIHPDFAEAAKRYETNSWI